MRSKRCLAQLCEINIAECESAYDFFYLKNAFSIKVYSQCFGQKCEFSSCKTLFSVKVDNLLFVRLFVSLIIKDDFYRQIKERF